MSPELLHKAENGQHDQYDARRYAIQCEVFEEFGSSWMYTKDVMCLAQHGRVGLRRDAGCRSARRIPL